MNCLFCKIAAGEIPSEKIYEDDHVFAFLDIHPLSKGHTVVITKVHAENIIDLPEEEVGPVFSAMRKIADIVEKAVGAKGLTIGINHRVAAGQAIGHLHIHIIPRFDGDGGKSIHSILNNPPAESLADVRKMITNSY